MRVTTADQTDQFKRVGELTPLITSSIIKPFSLATHSSEISASPSLVLWIGPALACAFCYAMYSISIKKGSNSIHPILGGVILQIVAAILGCCLLLAIIAKEGTSELEYDMKGIQWSICAGLAVGLAEIISFFVSGMGVQAMQSIPIVTGGSVACGTVLGLLLLKENLSYQGWLGVLLLVVGISLVGTDTGSST